MFLSVFRQYFGPRDPWQCAFFHPKVVSDTGHYCLMFHAKSVTKKFSQIFFEGGGRSPGRTPGRKMARPSVDFGTAGWVRPARTYSPAVVAPKIPHRFLFCPPSGQRREMGSGTSTHPLGGVTYPPTQPTWIGPAGVL